MSFNVSETKDMILWLRERGAMSVTVGEVSASFLEPANVSTHVDSEDIIEDTPKSETQLRRLSELEDHLLTRFGKDAAQFLNSDLGG
jgi:hypothetical protein